MLRNLIFSLIIPSCRLDRYAQFASTPLFSLFPFLLSILVHSGLPIGRCPARATKINPWVALLLGRFSVTQNMPRESQGPPCQQPPLARETCMARSAAHQPLRFRKMYLSVALRVSPCTVPQSTATENLGLLSKTCTVLMQVRPAKRLVMAHRPLRPRQSPVSECQCCWSDTLERATGTTPPSCKTRGWQYANASDFFECRLVHEPRYSSLSNGKKMGFSFRVKNARIGRAR